MPLTTTLQIEFSSGVWTDVTADAMRDPIRLTRGIFGAGVLDRVAQPGSLSFTLNNSATNSGGVISYYSPGHASVRTGFDYGIWVRLQLSDGTNTRYKGRGKLTVIAPEPGAFGTRGTRCVATDWMNEFAEFDTEELTLQESARSDQLLDAIVDLMTATPPVATDYDTGKDTYTFAFDDLGGYNPKAMTLGQRICQSELGYLYLRGDATGGETLTFENRHARATATSAFTLTASHLQTGDGIVVPSSLDRIANDVKTQVFPRRVDSAATTVLISLDNTPAISPNESQTYWLDYLDPAQEAVFVGGKNMVSPVATTDYTANTASDGTGTDITANLTVTATYFGSRAKIVVSLASSSASGYITKLQCRGRGLYRYVPITNRAQNSTSITNKGLRPLATPLEMPYQDDRNIGQGAADYLANLYGSLGNDPERVTFVATKSSTLLEQAILRDIGDKITVTESVTGVNAIEMFIHALEYAIQPGNVRMTCTWLLAPADAMDVWVLDDAEASVLGTTTIPGYA